MRSETPSAVETAARSAIAKELEVAGRIVAGHTVAEGKPAERTAAEHTVAGMERVQV